jgi:hypothetical protein
VYFDPPGRGDALLSVRGFTITVVSTAGHARPGGLVEIDAVAIIPE